MYILHQTYVFPGVRYTQPSFAFCMRPSFGSQLTRVLCAQLVHGYKHLFQTGAAYDVQIVDLSVSVYLGAVQQWGTSQKPQGCTAFFDNAGEEQLQQGVVATLHVRASNTERESQDGAKGQAWHWCGASWCGRTAM